MTSHYIPYANHHQIKRLAPEQHDNQIPLRDKSILIIVNVQQDFLPGGALPIMAHKKDKGVLETEQMINSINELIVADVFDYYVFTQDVHLPGNTCLVSSHPDKKPFDVIKMKLSQEPQTNTHTHTHVQILWPDHCLNNHGLALSNELVLPIKMESWKEISPLMVSKIKQHEVPIVALKDIKLQNLPSNTDQNYKLMTDLLNKTYIMWNGLDNDVAPYSGFKDSLNNETGLQTFCIEKEVKNIYVCGVARDFAAWWTAADATTYESNGREFNVYFVLDATLPVPGSIDLPDYQTEKIKQLGEMRVHNDLEKNRVEQNLWTEAFLKPYGINVVSWEQAIHKLHLQSQLKSKAVVGGGKTIFTKSNKNKKPPQQKDWFDEVDYSFIMKVAKTK